MSSKDESIFSKEALILTKSGKEIMKQALVHSKGYRQFNKYREDSKRDFPEFSKRYFQALYSKIKSDPNPKSTIAGFVEEVGSTEMALEPENVQKIYDRLLDSDILLDRVKRILNSNFVKMTFPVFNALFDGATKYYGSDLKFTPDLKDKVVDGHIIAIDLSEPMDRILDKDEDLDCLDDFKLMNPYILEIAREKISSAGEQVINAFEKGFQDARLGQYIDAKLKMKPASIDAENMNDCYKKYRAVMGTAGRNMALNMRPLGDIFDLGMSKAGECVGCGNEIEDSLKNGYIKIPSWPLYFSINTWDIKKGFKLTMEKSDIYLQEAQLAVEMLPEDFDTRPFLDFLFLTVRHYNQYWFNELNKRGDFKEYENRIRAAIK